MSHYMKITIKHATQALQEGNKHRQDKAALTSNFEHQQHYKEYDSHLEYQDGKLSNQVSQKNFRHSDTCKKLYWFLFLYSTGTRLWK